MAEEKKETVDELLASRRAVYGDRVKNMERTAQLWSALLGVEIKDWQVPLLFSAYKMFRTFETPDYSDNSDDIDGWKKMFVEVMEANHGGIIQARTVEEYKAQKGTLVYTLPSTYDFDLPTLDSAMKILIEKGEIEAVKILSLHFWGMYDEPEDVMHSFQGDTPQHACRVCGKSVLDAVHPQDPEPGDSPHTYMTNFQAMGDCNVCGNGQQHELHRV